ncbi:MAG: hypothetical protein JW751_08780 [Polyangiaceae bacterium]|nr:hypothetical protein [Polyangiaceae bacterium]
MARSSSAARQGWRLCLPAIRTGGVKSREQAQQEYVASHDPGAGKDGSDSEVTAGIYGMVLNRGTYLDSCSVEATWGVSICAAVQNGAVVGVSVRTTPASAATGDCTAAKVREIIFPPCC